MKRHPLVLITLVLLVFCAAATVSAAEWDIDKAHSNIYFGIRHIYSTVRGQFHDFSGTCIFNPDDLTNGRVEITAQTQSVDTQITKRDDHLRGAEFFAVSQFPVMTFKSSSFKHLGGDKYQVTGDLTIKDVTQSIAVPFVFHGVKDNPLQKGKRVAGFDARFTIDRLAYHVGDGKFYKMGVLGKDVDILISLELLRDKD